MRTPLRTLPYRLRHNAGFSARRQCRQWLYQEGIVRLAPAIRCGRALAMSTMPEDRAVRARAFAVWHEETCAQLFCRKAKGLESSRLPGL
jgi:hypothetical protein